MIKKYKIINCANFRLDGGAMFGIIPRPLWSKKMEPDEQNRIDMALRLLLIQTGDKNILIDTGIGDYHGEKFEQRFDVRYKKNPIEQALEEENMKTSDITDLILSHLHFDHIGGMVRPVSNSQNMQCIFKNAMIHIHKDHYNYALNSTARDSGSFHVQYFKEVIEELDQSKRVNWLKDEQGTIIEEASINFKCSHGHTPYMIHPFDEKFLYMADLVPTAHHLSVPWVMGYDIAPGISSEEKVEFLKFAYVKKLKIIFEHDPVFSFSSVDHDERKGYIAKELSSDQYFN